MPTDFCSHRSQLSSIGLSFSPAPVSPEHWSECVSLDLALLFPLQQLWRENLGFSPNLRGPALRGPSWLWEPWFLFVCLIVLMSIHSHTLLLEGLSPGTMSLLACSHPSIYISCLITVFCFLIVCVCAQAFQCTHMKRSEDDLHKLVLFLHRLNPRSLTWVFRSGGKQPYLLSHLASP